MNGSIRNLPLWSLPSTGGGEKLSISKIYSMLNPAKFFGVKYSRDRDRDCRVKRLQF